MAFVKGTVEYLQYPLYDATSIKPGRRLGEVLTSNVLRFFQDVTGKTKLQTNMQAASVLPHWNTYEAHALRVVISDLPPVISETQTITLEVGVVKQDGQPVLNGTTQKKVELSNFKLTNFADFTRLVENSDYKAFRPSQDTLENFGLTVTSGTNPALGDNEFADLNRDTLKRATEQFPRDVIPVNEQIFPNDRFGSVIGKFIFNTVTTFICGEKTMATAPTYYFPAGAGPFSQNGQITTHGFPTPEATFRFAEPVKIAAQQNFRVEIEVIESDVLGELQRVYGPLSIWVILDGYLTRDVQ